MSSSVAHKLNGGPQQELAIDSRLGTGHQQQHTVHPNSYESRLNQLNQLNSINLLNSHQNLNNNIRVKKEFEINGNFINSSSDSENSDEITNENNRNCVESSGN